MNKELSLIIVLILALATVLYFVMPALVAQQSPMHILDDFVLPGIP